MNNVKDASTQKWDKDVAIFFVLVIFVFIAGFGYKTLMNQQEKQEDLFWLTERDTNREDIFDGFILTILPYDETLGKETKLVYDVKIEFPDGSIGMRPTSNRGKAEILFNPLNNYESCTVIVTAKGYKEKQIEVEIHHGYDGYLEIPLIRE